MTTYIITVRRSSGTTRDWRVLADNAAHAELMLRSTSRTNLDIITIRQETNS
jgi:hypothetical protein